MATKKDTRSIKSLSWEERSEMVQEFLTGKYTKVEIWRKYTGQDNEHGKILKWMRDLGYAEPLVNSRSKAVFLTGNVYQSPSALKESEPGKTQAELEAKIKKLEKELESARLQAEGYNLMIELAEKELKIAIRKKSDTK